VDNIDTYWLREEHWSASSEIVWRRDYSSFSLVATSSFTLPCLFTVSSIRTYLFDKSFVWSFN